MHGSSAVYSKTEVLQSFPSHSLELSIQLAL